MPHDNLDLFINDIIHTLNMIRHHRHICISIVLLYHSRKISVEVCDAELSYLNSIQGAFEKDFVLKIYGLLDRQNSHDHILAEKFLLNRNTVVLEEIKKLIGLFDLNTLKNIRNRYVGHLDRNHNGQRKKKPIINEGELLKNFSGMISIDTVEKAIISFTLILYELEGEGFSHLYKTFDEGKNFWKRYLVGVKIISNIDIQLIEDITI